jgi:HPt (histidine-containing phosphotransfer) domain-containing protein
MEMINLSYVKDVCGNDREIIAEMISIFRSQIPEFVGEMRSLLKNSQYNDLGLLAHKAKSSVAIMGMEDLAVELKRFELKARAGEDPDSYAGFIDRFERDTSVALRELDEYLNRN